MKGLAGVEVAVEMLRPEIELAGLTRDQLQATVELKLRKSGVRVLSTQEKLKSPGAPMLYVNLQTFQPEGAHKDLVFFYLKVHLKQSVFLARNMTPAVSISTWETDEKLGVVGISKVQELRRYVEDEVDRFCNAYLAANPKEGN